MTTTAVKNNGSQEQSAAPVGKKPSRKFGWLMITGAVLFIVISATAVVVRSSGKTKGRSITKIDLAVANRQEAYRAYIEKLTRVDLGVDSIENPGLLQQNYAILSQEFLRDAGILRNTPGHPYHRLSLTGTLHQFTEETNALIQKAEQGKKAVLVIEDEGGETYRISIPHSELAAIGFGRLWALALAENLKVSPRYNLKLATMQIDALQTNYKKAQRHELQTQGMVDAASQISTLNPQSQEK